MNPGDFVVFYDDRKRWWEVIELEGSEDRFDRIVAQFDSDYPHAEQACREYARLLNGGADKPDYPANIFEAIERAMGDDQE